MKKYLVEIIGNNDNRITLVTNVYRATSVDLVLFGENYVNSEGEARAIKDFLEISFKNGMKIWYRKSLEWIFEDSNLQRIYAGDVKKIGIVTDDDKSHY